MKRFIVFSYEDGKSKGGFNDFYGSYDTIEDAINSTPASWDGFTSQIIDTLTSIIVQSN